MAVTYEWLVEELVEPGGDIFDTNQFSDAASMMRAVARLKAEGKPYSYGIVRDRWDETGDLKCRSWAYADNGELPEAFEDAGCARIAKVPAKFVRELAKLDGGK